MASFGIRYMKVVSSYDLWHLAKHTHTQKGILKLNHMIFLSGVQSFLAFSNHFLMFVFTWAVILRLLSNPCLIVILKVAVCSLSECNTIINLCNYWGGNQGILWDGIIILKNAQLSCQVSFLWIRQAWISKSHPMWRSSKHSVLYFPSYFCHSFPLSLVRVWFSLGKCATDIPVWNGAFI